MRLPSSVLYLSIDPFLPPHGKPAHGLNEFSAEMEHAGVPVVWVSSRNRFQLDAPLRAVGHNHPVIAEGACGVYIPEGYFNVRGEKAIRLGRFMCIPIAQPQPAAAEMLEELSSETGVETVPLAALSPRELAQNSGLPTREAELLRHRDFDELFFFAGADEEEIVRFRVRAKERGAAVRLSDSFWSIARGANMAACVRESGRLYERAMRTRAGAVVVALRGENLLSVGDRQIALSNKSGTKKEGRNESVGSSQRQELDLTDPELWGRLAVQVLRRR